VEAAPAKDPASTVFYLPHQVVKKEQHGKTKRRIVFDASSHETNSPSLNEVLEMGSNLLSEISILLSFRLYLTAIVSDTTQAFLGPRRERQRLDQIFLVQNHAGQ
jgi:hypothetical protein